WREGFFSSDRSRLMERLSSSKVFWGPVKDTLGQFFDDHPPPIGAIFFDLDDSMDLEPINDWTGERLAVNEFNARNERRKIARRYQAPGRYVRAPWLLKVFIYHDFDHPDYCKWVSTGRHQLPLST